MTPFHTIMKRCSRICGFGLRPEFKQIDGGASLLVNNSHGSRQVALIYRPGYALYGSLKHCLTFQEELAVIEEMEKFYNSPT